jgi:hypothetical protein
MMQLCGTVSDELGTFQTAIRAFPREHDADRISSLHPPKRDDLKRRLAGRLTPRSERKLRKK